MASPRGGPARDCAGAASAGVATRLPRTTNLQSEVDAGLRGGAARGGSIRMRKAKRRRESGRSLFPYTKNLHGLAAMPVVEPAIRGTLLNRARVAIRSERLQRRNGIRRRGVLPNRALLVRRERADPGRAG